MKKLALSLVLVASVAFVSCKDTAKETTTEETTVITEETTAPAEEVAPATEEIAPVTETTTTETETTTETPVEAPAK